MSSTGANRSHTRRFAIMSVILGAIGWFAAFELLTEYIKTLQTPGYVPNCAVSVLVTCGPNMGSWQGSVFGFSNTIIGVAGFVAPIAVGVAMLSGARFAAWFWWLYRAGLLFGIGFTFWLSYQSVFALGTLCPWCMVVWAVMIPLFFFSLFAPEAHGFTRSKVVSRSAASRLASWAWVCVLVSYLIIAAFAQFQLNWLAEFTRP